MRLQVSDLWPLWERKGKGETGTRPAEIGIWCVWRSVDVLTRHKSLRLLQSPWVSSEVNCPITFPAHALLCWDGGESKGEVLCVLWEIRDAEEAQSRLRSGKPVNAGNHNEPEESLTIFYKMIMRREDSLGSLGFLSPQTFWRSFLPSDEDTCHERINPTEGPSHGYPLLCLHYSWKWVMAMSKSVKTLYLLTLLSEGSHYLQKLMIYV